MRASGLVFLGWAACQDDPQRDAWHGAFKLESAQEGLDSCEAELVEYDNPEPYVFVAVERGIPDVGTLYWCDGPEECEAPVATVWLRTFTLTELTGDAATGEAHGNLCTARWTDLAASQEGDQVELTLRTGLSDEVIPTGGDCDVVAQETIGKSCDAVLVLSGTRVEG
jgi:hypothetical protein